MASSSLTATLDAEFSRRTHDVIISFDALRRVDRTATLAETVPGVEKAEMWIVAPVTILHLGQRTLDAGMGSQLQGVPVDDPMYKPKIVGGRWLQPSDGKAVVMNKETADDEHIRLGETITLDTGEWGKDDWQVVGLYQVSLVIGSGFSTDALYAPRPAVYEATKKTGKGWTPCTPAWVRTWCACCSAPGRGSNFRPNRRAAVSGPITPGCAARRGLSPSIPSACWREPRDRSSSPPVRARR